MGVLNGFVGSPLTKVRRGVITGSDAGDRMSGEHVPCHPPVVVAVACARQQSRLDAVVVQGSAAAPKVQVRDDQRPQRVLREAI